MGEDWTLLGTTLGAGGVWEPMDVKSQGELLEISSETARLEWSLAAGEPGGTDRVNGVDGKGDAAPANQADGYVICDWFDKMLDGACIAVGDCATETMEGSRMV